MGRLEAPTKASGSCRRSFCLDAINLRILSTTSSRVGGTRGFSCKFQYLDAALSWKPLDPWANLGWFEEGASLLQPTGVSGFSWFFPYFTPSVVLSCSTFWTCSFERVKSPSRGPRRYVLLRFRQFWHDVGQHLIEKSDRNMIFVSIEARRESVTRLEHFECG